MSGRRAVFDLPSRGRRGISKSEAILLLMIILLFLSLRMMSNSEKAERRQAVQATQSDPQSLVEAWFLESGRELPYKEKGWEELLNFMSQDDRSWFEANSYHLAPLTQELEGVMALAATERERRYAVLRKLTRFGPPPQQWVVSQVKTNETHGVVFIHPPGDVTGLREVFIVKEGDYWKIRRFLGTRDDSTIMHPLVELKNEQGLPLSDDEIAYMADPQNYSGRKTAELRAQAGLVPAGP